MAPRMLPADMFESLLVVLIAILIVMPVVAILIMGLQRLLGATWSGRVLAIASLSITAVVVVVYLGSR
jgi:hypothetical protein